jgi:hypothetical protein
MSRSEVAPDATPVAVPIAALLVSACVLAALFAFDAWVLRTPVLTPFVADGDRLQASTPLYAFWKPLWRPAGALFVLALGGLVWLAPRLCDPDRTRSRVYAAALVAASVILPLTLFALRQPVAELGALLTLYPGEEVIYDAQRIDALPAFLARYVEEMPRLSLHGRHFPPGHASAAYAAFQLFGSALQPLAWSILAAFAAAIWMSQRALAAIAGERAARGGALLLLASPSLLDFACTSFDALFLFWAALAFWSVAQLASQLASPAPARRFTLAAATGAALFAATFASFSALPLGLAIGLYLTLAGRPTPARTAVTLLCVGAVYLTLGLLLYAATGFSLLECLGRAIELNRQFMREVMGDLGSLRARLAFGNVAAFAIGAGVALCAAVGTRLVTRRRAGTAWNVAAGLTLAVMSFGGIYFMETERIWLFAVPWLAAIAVSAGPLDARSLRMLLAAGGLQALIMESLLLTLW